MVRMVSLAPTPTGAQLRLGFRERARTGPLTQLRLRPDGDGWALLASDGELVFRAPGLRGRQRCLRFARAHGVLAIFR